MYTVSIWKSRKKHLKRPATGFILKEIVSRKKKFRIFNSIYIEIFIVFEVLYFKFKLYYNLFLILKA